MLKKIEIFIDGSCIGNPGPGGYGIILRHYQYKKEFSASYRLTTNNRMELMAAIVALETLKNSSIVDISTDSQYLRKGITQWILNWKKFGWRTYDKKIIKNIDLWKKLDIAASSHILIWNWVKGHAGNLENERCDALARSAAKNPILEDSGYLS